jgi:acylphosphatase
MQIPSDQTRAHLRIQGRVQGVYFRASTVAEAQRFALTGWVRNCSDGSVEVVAEGSRAAIEELIVWCRHGPDGARVAQVQIDWEQPQNNFAGFTIKR